MNNQFTFIIPGEPIAQQRPRKGAHGNWYNPQSTIKKQVALCMANQLPDSFAEIEKGIPVKCIMQFFFSAPKASKNTMAADTTPCLNKKDLDNCFKFYMDCMNGVVWHDDNQIYIATIRKMYSLNPRTEIEVAW